MQYSIIQKKSEKELFDLINELKAELFLLRFKNKTGQQDQTHKIKLVRRDIAKVLTALKYIESGQPIVINSAKEKKVKEKVVKKVKEKVVKQTKDKEVK